MPRPNCTLHDVSSFIAAGNTFSGSFKSASKLMKIEWEGSGNNLAIGEGSIFKKGNIQLFGGAKVEIGNECEITGTIRADKGSCVSIGNRTRINRPSTIRASEKGKVTIGNYCLFANVLIRNSDLHAVVDRVTGQRTNTAADITLHDKVWLAEDVYVYKGVEIGTNTVVASRSTVIKSLPAHCIAAGTPAKVIRENTSWHRSLDPKKWVK